MLIPTCEIKNKREMCTRKQEKDVNSFPTLYVYACVFHAPDTIHQTCPQNLNDDGSYGKEKLGLTRKKHALISERINSNRTIRHNIQLPKTLISG